jgi:hypothetical protein
MVHSRRTCRQNWSNMGKWSKTGQIWASGQKLVCALTPAVHLLYAWFTTVLR